MAHPYEQLTPDLVLDAVESCGPLPSGHQLALNSYENRVIQIGIEDGPDLVAKFYRPERWSNPAILEEHHFTQALAAEEVPVIAPCIFNGQTLHQQQGFRFALFERRGGRAPETDNLEQLEWIGRFIGRIHQLGKTSAFQHRPQIDCHRLGWQAREHVLNSRLLPIEHQSRYAQLSQALIEACESAFAEVQPDNIRLHGDCHHGNILWTDAGPHFVDMDDCANGPAVQDLWMLLHADATQANLQLDALLEGYRTFCEFNPAELKLVEPLRALRLLHYTGWLSQRWNDPAFPAAFPWFGEASYWPDHLADLEQQALRFAHPPQWFGG